ncbi:MAG: hypothetical protein CVT89_02270 [Candidatus Altiarchaeales archaeon HGW-Altiarchaeales-2]|nr:MAG: hypothetical protein CVT89_02270 [Candidatus Altiarchaeales archaeon HGW-Altiarchaeales-2]
MKFALSVTIKGSREFTEISKSEIDDVLSKAENLKKGIDGEFKINVNIDKDIKLEILSDYRAHRDKQPLKPISVPFAEVRFEGNLCNVLIKDADENFLMDNYADRLINLIKEKVAKQYYEGKKEYWNLLWQSEKKDMKFNTDPSEEMRKRGWIFQISKGKWFYFPQAAHLLNVMKTIAVEEFVKEDLKELVDINYGITYAQCPMIYQALNNKTIAEDNLPLKIFERTVNSARYESGGTHGIERVDEFHRIECVYIGTPEVLAELKEKMTERYKFIFNEILDLEWRMADVVPFYMQHAGEAECVKGEGAKLWKGTVDFEAYLPYRGNREESQWLEFQNLSIVGDKYTSAFNIKTQKGELWSGCTGIGLERWLVAFLAQHGFNYDDWPEKFKNYAKREEIEKGIKFL